MDDRGSVETRLEQTRDELSARARRFLRAVHGYTRLESRALRIRFSLLRESSRQDMMSNELGPLGAPLVKYRERLFGIL